jgi:hypothetical protein
VRSPGTPVTMARARPGSRRREGGGEPAAERRGVALVGVQDVDETEGGEPPGPDELLAAGVDPRHEHRGPRRGEQLAHAVVAGHRDHGVRPGHELGGVGDEVEHAGVVAAGGQVAQLPPVLLRHVRPGDRDRPDAGRQRGLEEGARDVDAVLAPAHEAQGVALAGAADPAGPRAGARARLAAPPEVAGVDGLGRHLRRQPVLQHRVVDGRVAVHPDGVVGGAEHLVGAVPLPLPPGDDRVVEHLPEAEHDAGRQGGADGVEDAVQLAVDAPGHLVHHEEVGGEGEQRRGDDHGAQPQDVGERRVEDAAGVAAVGPLGEGREGEDLGPRGERQGRRLRRPRQEQDVGRGVGVHERRGDRDVPADVAEALGVVGVQRDPREPAGQRVRRAVGGAQVGPGRPPRPGERCERCDVHASSVGPSAAAAPGAPLGEPLVNRRWPAGV